MKRPERERLMKEILEYWWDCVTINGKKDAEINGFMDDYCGKFSHPYMIGEGWEPTLENFTNSQLRKLLAAMIASGIKTN